MAENNKERNRRLKLGSIALGLVVVVYAVAKITNDTSGDWWRFSLLAVSLVGFIGGYLTLTDIFGKGTGRFYKHVVDVVNKAGKRGELSLPIKEA